MIVTTNQSCNSQVVVPKNRIDIAIFEEINTILDGIWNSEIIHNMLRPVRPLQLDLAADFELRQPA